MAGVSVMRWTRVGEEAGNSFFSTVGGSKLKICMDAEQAANLRMLRGTASISFLSGVCRYLSDGAEGTQIKLNNATRRVVFDGWKSSSEQMAIFTTENNTTPSGYLSTPDFRQCYIDEVVNIELPLPRIIPVPTTASNYSAPFWGIYTQYDDDSIITDQLTYEQKEALNAVKTSEFIIIEGA